MKQWEPMFMEPEFKETIWGGTKLMGLYNKKIPSGNTGESWEVSAHENGQSRIRNGFLAGKTLQEALFQYPSEILGNRYTREYGNKFPLIVKLIDAAEDLSIQVHPDEEMAKFLEGPSGSGKTEMWYILDAESESRIALDFKKAMSPEALEKAIQDGTLEDKINYIPVKRGDTFLIPPGTLHAIGSGIVLAEIQQASDITYRVYDYKREGLDGMLRPLHIEKAKQVLNYKAYDGSEIENIEEGVVCDAFQVYKRTLRRIVEIMVTPDHFQILMILEGSGKIDGIPFKKGDTILLPAAGETVALFGQAVYLQIL